MGTPALFTVRHGGRCRNAKKEKTKTCAAEPSRWWHADPDRNDADRLYVLFRRAPVFGGGDRRNDVGGYRAGHAGSHDGTSADPKRGANTPKDATRAVRMPCWRSVPRSLSRDARAVPVQHERFLASLLGGTAPDHRKAGRKPDQYPGFAEEPVPCACSREVASRRHFRCLCSCCKMCDVTSEARWYWQASRRSETPAS